jgi:hypothetical protein
VSSACMPARRSSRPICACGRSTSWSVRSEAEGKRDQDEEGSETYERAPLVSECKEGKEMVVSWAAVSARVGSASGLPGSVGLLGQLGRRFT